MSDCINLIKTFNQCKVQELVIQANPTAEIISEINRMNSNPRLVFKSENFDTDQNCLAHFIAQMTPEVKAKTLSNT